MRLVQIQNGPERRVAIVEEPRLRLLNGHTSVHELADAAIREKTTLTQLIKRSAGDVMLDYDPIYSGQSDWKLLTPIDHPQEPSRCLVSGTGLTHLGSARNRQAMHAASDQETDSMKMFRWGVEAGRPQPGQVGVPPEWFFKGNGSILRAHAQALEVPAYALDGGEEAEIAGVYGIDGDGNPYRIGMVIGNEFSDHVFEKKNYLNLAGSKIRTCSLGPELNVSPDFSTVAGTVSIERGGKTIWSKSIRTGENEMSHSLANIEHHHFKFETHRRPGDLHVHYYGACALSFGDGVTLAGGDVMVIEFENFGRPLRNPLKVAETTEQLIRVASLT